MRRYRVGGSRLYDWTEECTWDFGAATRLRVRHVNLTALVAAVEAQAQESGQVACHAEHGGTVCNTYGYAAETECAVVASDGTVTLIWCGRAPANKATLSGACDAAGAYAARPIYDARCGKASVRYAWRKLRALLCAVAQPGFDEALAAADAAGLAGNFWVQQTLPLESANG